MDENDFSYQPELDIPLGADCDDSLTYDEYYNDVWEADE